MELTELDWLALETGLSYLGTQARSRRARRVDDELAREAWRTVSREEREQWQTEHPGWKPWASRYHSGRQGRLPADAPGPVKVRGRCKQKQS